MGIFLKGFNTSKSLSPVIMQEAFAAAASSGNLLSLGVTAVGDFFGGRKLFESLFCFTKMFQSFILQFHRSLQ